MVPAFGSTTGARGTGARVGAPLEADARVGAGVAPEVGVEEDDAAQPQFTLNCFAEDATYRPLPVKSPGVVRSEG